MLERVPLEILRTIINLVDFCYVGNAASDKEQVSAQSDLKALCEVSKHLHQATVSRLYKTIRVLLDQVSLDHADLSCFYGDNMRYLEFVKVLIFKTSFHIDLRGFEEDDDAEDTDDDRVDDNTIDPPGLDCENYAGGEKIDDDEIDGDEIDQSSASKSNSEIPKYSAGIDYDEVNDNGIDQLSKILMPFFNYLKAKYLQEFGWDVRTCVPAVLLPNSEYLTGQQKCCDR